MITEYVNPKVLAEWAQAQQALMQELIREAQNPSVPSGDAQQELLTPDELAKCLKVSVSWVYEQSRLGNVPTHKIGKYSRFRLAEVLEDQATRDALERRRSAETKH